MKQYVMFFILALLSINSAAEMYKWVDEEGNIQYTQTPPPEGVESSTVTSVKTNSISAGKSAQPAASEEATAANDPTAAKPPDSFKDCEEANKQLQVLNSGKQLVVPDPKEPGKFVPMPAVVRQQQVAVAQTYLQQNQCQETAPPKPTSSDESVEQAAPNSPQAQCEQAQQQLAETEGNTNLVVQDPNNPGKFVPLTEEMRKQRVELLKANVKRFCQ